MHNEYLPVILKHELCIIIAKQYFYKKIGRKYFQRKCISSIMTICIFNSINLIQKFKMTNQDGIINNVFFILFITLSSFVMLLSIDY